jgi:hypothetical protein
MEISLKNAEIAVSAGCEYVAIIKHQGSNTPLDQLFFKVENKFPQLKVIINRLNKTPESLVIQNLAIQSAGSWLNFAGISPLKIEEQAFRMQKLIETSKPEHLMFVGVAFKYKAPEKTLKKPQKIPMK